MTQPPDKEPKRFTFAIQPAIQWAVREDGKVISRRVCIPNEEMSGPWETYTPGSSKGPKPPLELALSNTNPDFPKIDPDVWEEWEDLRDPHPGSYGEVGGTYG